MVQGLGHYSRGAESKAHGHCQWLSSKDNDCITLIVGNPDKQAAEEALDKIIDRIVRKQR